MERKKVLIITGVISIIIIIFFLVVLMNNSSDSKVSSMNGKNSIGGVFSNLFTPKSSLGLSKQRLKRELTEDEKEETEREIKRMKEKIPGNIYIPGILSQEEAKIRRKMLRDVIYFGNKIRKGTATEKEKKRFYNIKEKQVTDKIEFIHYVLNRTKELSKENGKTYFNNSIILQSERVIELLKEKQKEIKEELNNL